MSIITYNFKGLKHGKKLIVGCQGFHDLKDDVNFIYGTKEGYDKNYLGVFTDTKKGVIRDVVLDTELID